MGLGCRVMRLFVTIILALWSVQASAYHTDRSRASIIRYFDAVADRIHVAVIEAVWPDACRLRTESGQKVCDELASVPYGRSGWGNEYVINDMHIWQDGNRAVASVHMTEMGPPDPESAQHGGARAVCLRQVTAERRGEEWRVSSVELVFCQFYSSW